jgi:hypothetical protein
MHLTRRVFCTFVEILVMLLINTRLVFVSPTAGELEGIRLKPLGILSFQRIKETVMARAGMAVA